MPFACAWSIEMRWHLVRRICTAAVICTLGAIHVSNASAQSSGVQISKPPVQVGDRWTYRRMDVRRSALQYTFEHEVTFVSSETIIVLETRNNDKNDFTATYTPEWNGTSYGTGQVFQPQTGWFRFPLVIGDRYSGKFEQVAKKGSQVRVAFEGDVHIVGWEDITVPAGKFRAIKMSSTGTYRRLDVIGSGQYSAATWYVPALRRWVKQTYEDPGVSRADELVEFGLK
jgi:hypothetical protein